MRGGVLVGIHQFVLPILSEVPNLLSNKTHFLPLERSPCSRLGLDSKRVNRFSSSLIVSASSASVSGSGAEYSEQLLGTKPKQKRKRIAGIDQDDLLDPALLADPDSCFCEFKGVQIHHKVCAAEALSENLLQEHNVSHIPSLTKRVGLPMILLHGFGASLFSWHRVMKPLAQVTGSKVLAFDRPAFGLTSRVNPHEHSSSSSEDMKPLNPYSVVFSVLALLYFMDLLSAQKAVLMGLKTSIMRCQAFSRLSCSS